MVENPYHSPVDAASTEKKQRIRRVRLIWAGLALLAMSLTCFLGSIVFWILADQNAMNPGTTTSPEDLAQDLAQRAKVFYLPFAAVLPLGILGLVLLLVGIMSRRKAV